MTCNVGIWKSKSTLRDTSYPCMTYHKTYMDTTIPLRGIFINFDDYDLVIHLIYFPRAWGYLWGNIFISFDDYDLVIHLIYFSRSWGYFWANIMFINFDEYGKPWISRFLFVILATSRGYVYLRLPREPLWPFLDLLRESSFVTSSDAKRKLLPTVTRIVPLSCIGNIAVATRTSLCSFCFLGTSLIPWCPNCLFFGTFFLNLWFYGTFFLQRDFYQLCHRRLYISLCLNHCLNMVIMANPE